jgi:Mn-dependent DtxR family transcriptional regulator
MRKKNRVTQADVLTLEAFADGSPTLVELARHIRRSPTAARLRLRRLRRLGLLTSGEHNKARTTALTKRGRAVLANSVLFGEDDCWEMIWVDLS